MEVDLSQLDAATRQRVDEIFRKDFDLRVLKAVERQTRTATERRDRVRWHSELKPQFEIDPFVDSIWRQFYGHNYTENPDLMRFLQRRNPEIALAARSNKIMVGYTGRTGRCGRVRFGRGTIEFQR